MYNANSSPTVTNCTFSGNSAVSGGGMYNRSSSPTVTNCVFSGNVGRSRGGGMSTWGNSPRVTNCTFSGNSAGSGGGGMYSQFGSSPIVSNCILWNDSPDEIVDVGGAATTVRFSNVQGGWPGQGNIDADPLFVTDPSCGDYFLSPDSPCIDAADNTAVPPGVTSDLCDNPRFVDDAATPDTGVPGGAGGDAIVDMGAYEFQACDPCDMDCDGTINAFDIEPFLDLLFGPGKRCAPCTGDVNGDGNIDAFDIEPFLECLFP